MNKRIDEGLMQKDRKESTFKSFVWNPDTREFLGRSGESWIKISAFYVCFYSALALFFAVLMAIFYLTVDQNYRPKYLPMNDDGTPGGSLLQSPALGFRPLPRRRDVLSSLIWYKNGDSQDIQHWVQQLNKYIERKRKIFHLSCLKKLFTVTWGYFGPAG